MSDMTRSPSALVKPCPSATGAAGRTLELTLSISPADTGCFQSKDHHNRETANLPRPGDVDICVLWTQPAACTPSVTHALCIPLSYSSLCSVQRPALSSLSWLLLPSSCCGDKSGWDARGHSFFQTPAIAPALCSWDTASLSTHCNSLAVPPLGQECAALFTEGSKTGRVY